jgi:hypothetical protein
MTSDGAIVHQIPDELLKLVLRIVGARQVLASLPKVRRFHDAWRAIVVTVRLSSKGITEADIKVLAKFVNTTRLCFQ